MLIITMGIASKLYPFLFINFIVNKLRRKITLDNEYYTHKFFVKLLQF